jgi:hypothetical protein
MPWQVMATTLFAAGTRRQIQAGVPNIFSAARKKISKLSRFLFSLLKDIY